MPVTQDFFYIIINATQDAGPFDTVCVSPYSSESTQLILMTTTVMMMTMITATSGSGEGIRQ